MNDDASLHPESPDASLARGEGTDADEEVGPPESAESAVGRKRARTTKLRPAKRRKDTKAEGHGKQMGAEGVEAGDKGVGTAASTPRTAAEAQMAQLRLRRIIKENHGSNVNQIVFNFRRQSLFADAEAGLNVHALSGDCANVVATVGGHQVNVYDNEHDVDHLDIMSHFVVDGGEQNSAGSDKSATKNIEVGCNSRFPGRALADSGF